MTHNLLGFNRILSLEGSTMELAFTAASSTKKNKKLFLTILGKVWVHGVCVYVYVYTNTCTQGAGVYHFKSQKFPEVTKVERWQINDH